MKIFLDPGHGGKDPGAIGPSGLHEAAVALDVAERTMRFLTAAGHEVFLSRTQNSVTLELGERAQMANQWGADLFISIHCNAAENPNAEGFEVWTTKGQTEADKVAQAVFASFGRAFPAATGRKDLSDGDNDKEAQFAVLRLTKAPAILVETGFIMHPQTETAAAGAIAGGVTHWLHHEDVEGVPA